MNTIIKLAMPPIILRAPEAPLYLLAAARTMQHFATFDLYEAVWLDALLATACEELECGPETDRDIAARASAPAQTLYTGYHLARFNRLVERNKRQPTALEIAGFIMARFQTVCSDPLAAFDESALISDYEDLGVSTGYIGNLEPWGDNRSFRVFTRVRTQSNPNQCSVHVMDAPEPYSSKLRGDYPGPVPFNAPWVRAQLDALRQKVQNSDAIAHLI